MNVKRRTLCRHWLLPALAVLFAPAVMAQGIVYVHAPLSNPNGDPNHLPWDSLGTQVGPDFPIVINGQTVFTLTTPQVLGQPSKLIVQPSSTSAIIGQQPFLDFPDDVWAMPLTAGQEIGSNAAGYNWFDISVHFSATSTESAVDFQFSGPIDSVYPPQDGFPGGETISYGADFTLNDIHSCPAARD